MVVRFMLPEQALILPLKFVVKKEQVMKISTAIAVLQKDADFLGMPLLDFLKFVKTNPMAQTQKTLEAYRVFEVQAAEFFA